MALLVDSAGGDLRAGQAQQQRPAVGGDAEHGKATYPKYETGETVFYDLGEKDPGLKLSLPPAEIGDFSQ